MSLCEEPEHVKGKETLDLVKDYFVIYKSQPSWEYYDLLCMINNFWNTLDHSICRAICENTMMKPWKHNSVILGSVTVNVHCCHNHIDMAQGQIKDCGGN